MATARKALTAVNDELVLNIPTDRTAIAGVQYPTGGTGTYVLEGNIMGGVVAGDWLTVPVTPIAGGAAVTSFAVAGIWWADVSYLEQVRVRKTVGAAQSDIILTVTMP